MPAVDPYKLSSFVDLYLELSDVNELTRVTKAIRVNTSVVASIVPAQWGDFIA